MVGVGIVVRIGINVRGMVWFELGLVLGLV